MSWQKCCLPNSFLEPVQLLLQDNKLCSKADTERKWKSKEGEESRLLNNQYATQTALSNFKLFNLYHLKVQDSRHFTCWNFVTGLWHPVTDVDSTKQPSDDETSSSACTKTISLHDILATEYRQFLEYG